MSRARIPRPKLGELVLCTIDDTTSIGGAAGAWLTPEEIFKRKTSPIEASGWVVQRDERFLALAGLRDVDPSNESVGNVILLPWGSITKIERLVRGRR